MRGLIFFLLTSLVCLSASAQEPKKYIREGNKHYEKKDYIQAEKSYRSALQQKKDSFKAMYNLGNAYYKQQKYKEAAAQFETLAARNPGMDTLQKIYHNLGNSLLMQKDYEKSISAYKKALKIDPKDEDTRYNLAYAQKMLQQKQQSSPQDQRQKENKQDEKRQDSQQQDKKEAQKMFEALNNEEKAIQEKMKAGKRQVPPRSGKDW